MNNEIAKVRIKLNQAIDDMNFDIAIKLTKLLQELIKAEKELGLTSDD